MNVTKSVFGIGFKSSLVSSPSISLQRTSFSPFYNRAEGACKYEDQRNVIGYRYTERKSKRSSLNRKSNADGNWKARNVTFQFRVLIMCFVLYNTVAASRSSIPLIEWYFLEEKQM